MTHSPIIDHDPDPHKPADGMWWLWPLALAVVVLGWGLYLYSRAPDWYSLGLGAFTGMMFAFWACERHGPGPYLRRPGKKPPEGRG